MVLRVFFSFLLHTQLLSKVAAVHTVFVTGLLFLPLLAKKQESKKGEPSSGKLVSKREKLVLISVSADRTCSATLVTQKSGIYLYTVCSRASNKGERQKGHNLSIYKACMLSPLFNQDNIKKIPGPTVSIF